MHNIEHFLQSNFSKILKIEREKMIFIFFEFNTIKSKNNQLKFCIRSLGFLFGDEGFALPYGKGQFGTCIIQKKIKNK